MSDCKVRTWTEHSDLVPSLLPQSLTDWEVPFTARAHYPKCLWTLCPLSKMLVNTVPTSKEDKRVKGSEAAKCEVTIGYQVLMLTLSCKNLEFTLGGCSGRTWWSSLLHWATTYTILQWLYYEKSMIICSSRMFYDHLTLSCNMIT